MGVHPAVPTCPKCGKLISAKKYKRHLERCGQTHRRAPVPLRPGGDDVDMKL